MLNVITDVSQSGRSPRGRFRISRFWVPALLASLALPVSAIPITINTTGHVGEPTLFSITLFDGDLSANNTVDITNFTTDATPASPFLCTNGCQAIFRLSDTHGLGEFTQSISALGTFIHFDLTFTNAFDHTNPNATSDLVIGELLNLDNFHTNLNDPLAPVPYQDAVFVANLAANTVVGAAGIATVPVPGALVLFASGLALLSRRRSLRSAR